MRTDQFSDSATCDFKTFHAADFHIKQILLHNKREASDKQFDFQQIRWQS